MYDGSLSGIIDRFSGHKIVTLQWAGDQVPADLARYGEVLESIAPKARLRIRRDIVPEVLAAILANHAVEDVSVEDPPLEEVIAEMFSQVDAEAAADLVKSEGETQHNQVGAEARLRFRASTRLFDNVDVHLRRHSACPDERDPSTACHLVDHPAHLPRRAAGLSRRIRAGHVDAVSADRHADFLVAAVFSAIGGGIERHRQRPAAAPASPATPTTTSSPITC